MTRMTASGVIPSAEAHRRAVLLLDLYGALAETNPGFKHNHHMRSTDPVTVALAGGREKMGDLALLVSNDDTFHVWRLRLDHPWWWIGGRICRTTPLLARIISELTGRRDDGPHPGGSGYIGAHWFNQSLRAIAPLSSPARDQLAVALRRELIGRNMCLHGIVFMSFVSDRTFNPAEMFRRLSTLNRWTWTGSETRHMSSTRFTALDGSRPSASWSPVLTRLRGPALLRRSK